jgi:hypothetical protein
MSDHAAWLLPSSCADAGLPQIAARDPAMVLREKVKVLSLIECRAGEVRRSSQ